MGKCENCPVGGHPGTVEAVLDDKTLTVSELCRSVRTVIEEGFPDEVWVKGAISGLNRSPNGHVYFDLVDADDDLGAAKDNVVPVALFSASRARVNAILRRTGDIRMRDGVEIRIRGRVAFYSRQGRVQLMMSLIDPSYTIGQLAVARQALLDRLSAEGLLGANAALTLPSLPTRIGLVTSDASAAHADFVHELRASGYRFRITLFDARVQGDDAVPSLVDGIRRADQADVDVVVVIRGGGARTDLAAFDHERVARAIARCGRPVVVGVGHEVDRSVADEVANTSAKTPTAAAAFLVDAVEAFESEVERAASRLLTIAVNRLDRAGADLAADGRRLLVAANGSVDRARARLDGRTTTLDHHRQRAIDRAAARLDTIDARLHALDPAQTLARGWTITHTVDGRLVRGPADAPPGTALVTTTAQGLLNSTADAAPADEGGDAPGGSGS